MLKDKRHREEICKPLLWLSHWMVYGFGWGVTENLSLSTIDCEATFSQLPRSMIREHTLPPMVHLEWKMDSLCSRSSREARPLKALRMTKSSPSFGPSSTSSRNSFGSCSSPSSFSPSSPSKEAWNSTKVTILLFGHSEAMCPSPWDRKHLLLSSDLGGFL